MVDVVRFVVVQFRVFLSTCAYLITALTDVFFVFVNKNGVRVHVHISRF